ncbi:type I-B CRISPR-associated protein Cas8b1/Cst1 [Sulfitobacter sp. SK012]|uniref:type I-B CRISPR-associated protein Cas8b1/Cst1 n=1 Tax=Sulfitobacter sp. SK012 TaxID=1389005 RepID=UPI000E0AE6A0|nr:type I-B CRISPR-associated protein Cas8b1/Cst1 [Sulfitobacter sp. SK012]AXI45872.1 type I-B CRISPR-associated protein Cas8b1/Cst1 [Sulfitobacter sp. SK012]
MTETVKASCHCGAVVIEATLPEGLANPSRCTCSFCARRQAANVTAIATELKVLHGADHLTLYSWNTHTAKHYFCKTCGIYTHHQRRSDPTQCGINLGCIEGAQPWDHEPIPWADGIKHPADS